MSQPFDGRNMDWPQDRLPTSDRSRERRPAALPSNPRANLYHKPMAQQASVGYDAELSREEPQQGVIPPRPVRSKGTAGREGNIARVISRPSPVPQWPLAGPTTVPASQNSEPYRPPPGRPRDPPQRPPRPSFVPSLVDQSRPQQATPMFRAQSEGLESSVEYGQAYNPLSPPYASQEPAAPPARPQPEPSVAAAAPTSASQRRSVNLGPPPSSRRGQSSMYSTSSLVAPIPEESPRNKMHNSYASSAAMPTTWGAGSMGDSPGETGGFYEDSMTDKTRDSVSEYNDESMLMYGAKGESPLNSAHTAHEDHAMSNPFDAGAAYADDSSKSSATLFSNKQTLGNSPDTPNLTVPTPVAMLNSADLIATGSPQPPHRFSARRPPRLDMDAVKAAESRGSLTSLPDLIRRATRLAAMIDKGKRPSSRLDELDFFNEKSNVDWEKPPLDGHHGSGLSDMLAAFPPPVNTPQFGNAKGVSWPLAADQEGRREKISENPDVEGSRKRQTRRCCGLPAWAFVLLMIVVLCGVAAAVVLPLEFFVFKNLGNHSTSSSDATLGNCQTSLPCLNGGTNVIIDNSCSCICTNGFTGANCGMSGSAGCTTTNLVPTDGSGSINNVTLGRAIPRIIADSNGNFSIPLSGTNILARFNSGNLSCIAQNALITFDGQSTRIGAGSAKVQDVSNNVANVEINSGEGFVSISALTALPTRTSLPIANVHDAAAYKTSADGKPTPDPSASLARRSSPSSSSPSSASPTQTAAFTVTEGVLDFARTAVLYVLQEQSIDAANTAQTELQRFFDQASKSNIQKGSEVTVQAASSINIGGNNIIDLIGSTINVGSGPVGGKSPLKRDVSMDQLVNGFGSFNTGVKPGQATYPRGLAGCK